MTPQKLRPPYAGVTMHSAPALRNRPALAAEIAVVIGAWAEIEHMVGLIFADMLGGDAGLGLAIFFAMRTEGPQRDAIKATAAQRLSAELVAKIELMFKRVGNNSKERNYLAHGIWGYVDRLPNDLLWMDRNDTMRVFANTSEPAILAKELPISIYTLRHLQAASHKYESLLAEVTTLHREVRDYAERNPPRFP